MDEAPLPPTIGVLLADPIEARSVAAHVRDAGYQATVGTRADFAPTFQHASLIITDQPSAEGNSEALAWLKAERGAVFLPVLVAVSGRSDASRWLRAGFDDVLTAPIDADELIARIEVFLMLRERWGKALKADDQRFRITFEQAPIGIAHTDPSGRFLLVNPKYCAITGYTKDELAALHVRDLIHPDELAATLQQRAAWLARSDCSVLNFERRYVCKDGRDKWVNATLSLGTDDAGKPQYIITAVEDISPRKRMEQALRQSEARLAAFINHSPAVIMLKDLDGRYVEVNREFERVHGLRREQVLGRTSLELNMRGSAGITERDHAVFVTRRSTQLESEVMYPDGPRSCLVTRFPLFDAAGEIIGTCGIVIDISERKRAEAELVVRNTELSHTNVELSVTRAKLVRSEKLASIGQLAAGVAHEINNPIAYVFSNFGTLEGYLKDLLEMLAAYEAAEGLLETHAAGESLAGLRSRLDVAFLKDDILALLRESAMGITQVKKVVQGLKDFARSDETESWQKADLHGQIDASLAIVGSQIKYKADVVRAFGDLPPIECLPSQINQVLINLLLNAGQAIGASHGTITVRTGVSGADVWFEVQDSGCGISAADQARIFDPFFTTKPVGEGTGLGLSLTYGIVGKHNGHIDVSSQIGVGTTFRVVLPIEHVLSTFESALT